MRLRRSYTLRLISPLPEGFQLPFVVEMDGRVFEIPEISDESDDLVSAYVEGPVKASKLEVKTGPRPLSGGEPSKGIEVPEKSELNAFVQVMINVLSFLTDVPIRLSHKLGGDSLIAESEQDNELLRAMDTNQVFESLRAHPSVRSFSLPKVSYESLELLANKEVGLALYSQALVISNSVGTFREFWKVLESAFGTKNDDLVDLLTEYDPAIQLGFGEAELKQLLVMRGRASHAESSAGIDEYYLVRAETSAKSARLKCLVEQVLLTKKTWGIPTLETEPIADISGFIDAEGNIVQYR